jgi:uncharacterized membrane protein
MMFPSRAGFALCAVFLLALPHSAHAALTVCNRTSYVLYEAEGWTTPTDNDTQGWTRLIPGGCATPIQAMLTAPKYFLYARSSQAHGGEARAWGGTVQLCAKDGNFALKTPVTSTHCNEDEDYTVPFAPVNTHHMQSWTATLTESASIGTDEAARAAGLDRLLRDNGYKVSNVKEREAALTQFRTRMKIAPKASAADLFDALETAALKASAPAGYSLCNDTAGEIWAALGFRDGKDAISAGWWKIPAGTCARALTKPINLDRVFVHAEGHNKPQLVSGKDQFCVANVTFQVTGAENCRTRGLSAMGFAVTDTKGKSGYAAHVGNNGLLPPLRQASMPK